MNNVSTGGVVVGPTISLVEASAALVAFEKPEQGVAVALCEQMCAGGLDESEADARFQ